MNVYYFFNPTPKIVEYNTTSYIATYLLQPNVSFQNVGQKKLTYRINPTFKEIILQFNGEKTKDDIICYFCEKYNEDKTSVAEKVEKTIGEMKNVGYTLSSQKSALPKSAELRVFNNPYPSVVSLEITNWCNISCRHCYGDYREEGGQRTDLSFEDAKRIIDQLVSVGVSIIEITGGDPSINLSCPDIIEYAVHSGIHKVILLTNGVYLSPKLLAVLHKYRNQMFVQVDLHSLSDEYYDWFTNSSNHLGTVKKNIDLLINKGVQVRICSIFTPKNVHEMVDIGRWAHEHGAISYAPSVAVGIGRASKNINTIITDPKDLLMFTEQMDSLNTSFPGFIQDIEDANVTIKRKNCGAVYSEMSIDVNGDIKFCNMAPKDTIKFDFGNIIRENLKTILSRNQTFMEELSHIDQPDYTTKECAECDWKYFCHSCILRGIIGSFEKRKTTEGKCTWSESLPDSFKSKIQVIK